MEHRTFEEMASKEGWSLPEAVENYLYTHTRTSLSDKQFSQAIKTPSDARIGQGVSSGDIPAKEAFARSMAKNQAELTAAGKSATVIKKAAELQEAQLRGRVEGVRTAQANMAEGLQGKQLYKGVNDAIRAGEQGYFDGLSKPSTAQVGPATEPTVIVDSSLLSDAENLANWGEKSLSTLERVATDASRFLAAGLAIAGAIAATGEYANATTPVARDPFDPDESPGVKKAGVFALAIGAGLLDNSIAAGKATITGGADQGGFEMIQQSFEATGMSPTQNALTKWLSRP